MVERALCSLMRARPASCLEFRSLLSVDPGPVYSRLAVWIDSPPLGFLSDSQQRPGKPLRDLLRAGKIEHAYQEPNGRWWIACAPKQG